MKSRMDVANSKTYTRMQKAYIQACAKSDSREGFTGSRRGRGTEERKQREYYDSVGCSMGPEVSECPEREERKS